MTVGPDFMNMIKITRLNFPRVVYIPLRGGLGNQLFLYSAAVFASKNRHNFVLLDVYSAFKNDYKYLRKYSLSFLPIHPYIIFPSKFLCSILYYFFRISILYQGRFRSPTKSITKWCDRVSVPTNFPFSFLFSSSLFQESFIPSSVSSELLDSFNSFKTYKCASPQYYHFNQLNLSTAIHIRFFNNITDEYLSHLKLYINSAIKYLSSITTIHNLTFFSNDVVQLEFFIDFLLLKYDFSIFTSTSYDTPCDDLLAISMCKNHILTNSTFGWWGAFFANSKDVIIPKENFDPCAIEGNWNSNDLALDSWIVM